jgi:hypothetical protein
MAAPRAFAHAFSDKPIEIILPFGVRREGNQVVDQGDPGRRDRAGVAT